MAVRTTAAAVKLILRDGSVGSDYDGTTDLAPFIEAFSSVVDEVVSRAADDGTTISAAKAELMERWGAAHDYCLSDRLYASRNELGAGGSFQGQTGKGLDYTPYGQRARAFDSSGWLDALYSGNVARMDWLGKTAATQLTYAERNGV